MSVITDVVVMFEGVTREALSELELGYHDENDRPVNLLLVDAYHAGGTKIFCSSVAIGAFNHLDLIEFKNWLFKIAGKYNLDYTALIDSELVGLSIVTNRIGLSATSIESVPNVDTL